jgi:hypothetical protein
MKPPKKPKPTLQQLEAKYARQLAKEGTSGEALRKTREAIIKLRWEMGL